jgi:hypothetical protein
MGDIPSPLLTNRFTDAIDFALVAHCAQVRKGTRIPYLSHLLAVASLVIEHDGDEDAAIAAVLHDAPEDQGGRAMVEQIRARFGAEVAAIVEACNDTFDKPKPDWPPRKSKYVEHLAAESSLGACIVSAADKLHNARAILHDLRATDDHTAFWKRFGSPPKQIGWYYGRLERALDVRLAAHDGREMVVELTHALDAIAAIPGCDAFGHGLKLGRSGNACPEVPSDSKSGTDQSIAVREQP